MNESLTFENRQMIERMYNSGARAADIAKRLDKSASLIHVELKRGLTDEYIPVMRRMYSAQQAQKVFKEGVARRGKRGKGKKNKAE